MQKSRTAETAKDRETDPQTLDGTWIELLDACGNGYTAEDLARARAANQSAAWWELAQDERRASLRNARGTSPAASRRSRRSRAVCTMGATWAGGYQ
jgi:hypothetical protein